MPKLNDTKDKGFASKQLIITTVFSAIVTTAIASFYPAGRPVDEVLSLTFAECYSWVLSQSLLLTLATCLPGMLVIRWSPKYGILIGSILTLGLPWIYFADVLTFNWIGDRFLSATMAHIGRALLPALSLHLTQAAIIQGLFVFLSALCLSVTIVVVAKRSARRWSQSEDSISANTTAFVLVILALILASRPLLNWSVIGNEMRVSSCRHPFCAFHVVGFRGVGVKVRGESISLASRLRALDTFSAVKRREKQMLEINLKEVKNPDASFKVHHEKVILVVVECLRPEAISPELMPNLYRYAQKSIYMPQHFSGGNSTCLGMFSLLNGLETIWFHRGINEQPIYNRVMRHAGFELAFFGGQTDWRVYGMDGFINDQQYDEFVIEDPDLPQTDLNAVRRTLEFVDHDLEADGRTKVRDTKDSSVSQHPRGRAALCYLYGTHSSFRYSDPKYRVFLPEAEEGLLISNAPDLKEQFYNRYRNSLRSMDDILAPLLREDCVVLVMGDHGEPFLDDGTASHGTRLSKYQNQTPALVYYPGVKPRVIDSPTFHADLLPTLFSILDFSIDVEGVLDGIDLHSVETNVLNNRSFLTGNFMDATSLLVGPWTGKEDQPFGYRVIHDIHQWQTDYLNPIDPLGYETNQDDVAGRLLYEAWFLSRFGTELKDGFSDINLLCQCLRSPHREVRLAALKMVATLEELRPEVIKLVQEMASDDDQLVRERAKQLTISISRDQDWLSLFQ